MSVNAADVYGTSTAANATTTLPPLTAAIRQVWSDVGPVGIGPKPKAIAALLNAVYALELRVLTLEGTPFGG